METGSQDLIKLSDFNAKRKEVKPRCDPWRTNPEQLRVKDQKWNVLIHRDVGNRTNSQCRLFIMLSLLLLHKRPCPKSNNNRHATCRAADVAVSWCCADLWCSCPLLILKNLWKDYEAHLICFSFILNVIVFTMWMPQKCVKYIMASRTHLDQTWVIYCPLASSSHFAVPVQPTCGQS